ncbi:hypothetical protein AB4305_31845 [Nocardia sp. 2YAB30]|uniref:hypothetical protein n=1 Tax=Nocardia sp. 2YAB30 TaxID=3233022 RepID=UPI003F979899
MTAADLPTLSLGGTGMHIIRSGSGVNVAWTTRTCISAISLMLLWLSVVREIGSFDIDAP